MVGTSIVTGGFAIPLFASIATTYAASTATNVIKQKIDEKDQTQIYIDAKIDAVKEAFQYILNIYNLEICMNLIKRMKISHRSQIVMKHI